MSHTDMASGRPVAVVTGGLQGLGLQIVKDLRQAGFDVAVIDLAAAPANQALPESVAVANAGHPGHCRYYELDISALAHHQAVLARILADFGRLDCLVNNAGIAARPLTDLLELSPDAFDLSVDINLRGTFFLTQQFARLQVEHPSPDAAYRSIVFITSIAAEMVSTQRGQYCITKAALSMVSKLFAVRLAPLDIHVHEVRPGFMRTAMTASLGRTAVDEWIESGRVPLARWGSPEDIGRTVTCLAKGDLPYMTGEAICIGGGIAIPQAT